MRLVVGCVLHLVDNVVVGLFAGGGAASSWCEVGFDLVRFGCGDWRVWLF